MSTKSHRTRWSVSVITSLLAAGTIAAGMAIYAAAQYLADPAQSPWTLLFRHSTHVAVLGLVIYTCVVLVLHSLLVRPIHKIYLHLYAVGAGRLEPLRLQTRVRELAEIVDGVNVMIQRLEIGPKGAARGRVQTVAGELRDLAQTRAVQDSDVAAHLRKAAHTLEHSLAGLR